METTGIYKIENIENGKNYVGQSVNCEKRILDHKSFLRNDDHQNPHLQNAWNLYGKESFIFEILVTCNKEQLCFAEQYWIEKLDSFDNGYNLIPRADRKEFSEEHKYKCGNGNRGRKQSEEEKRKRSESMKRHYEENQHWGIGRNLSEEHKKKISDSLKEWHEENEAPAKFYTPTEEERKKISEASKRMWKEHNPTEKQLTAWKENLPPPEESKGSNNGFSKLNEQAVKVIKWFLINKEKTDNKLAELHNVSASNIGEIRRGSTWKHVKLEPSN